MSLRVEPARLRALQAVSLRTGARLAELMRRAINDYLARHLTPQEQEMLRREAQQKE